MFKYEPQQPIRNPNPKKLQFYEEGSPSKDKSLPRIFLDSLQKLMKKKKHVSDRCKSMELDGHRVLPHEVLGYNQNSLNIEATGQPNKYKKKLNSGSWINEENEEGTKNTEFRQASEDIVRPHKRPPVPPKRSSETHLSMDLDYQSLSSLDSGR